jgi:hypothetical protein
VSPPCPPPPDDRPRRRPWRPVAVVLAVAVAGCGSDGTPTSPPPQAQSSRAPEPPADLYVARNGSDKASCTAEAPCKTFNRAFEVAEPGQVVEVAAGSYADQLLDAAPKAGGPRVVFRPAAGADVTVASIGVSTGPVEFRDMRAKAGTYNDQDAHDVTYLRVHAQNLFIRGSSKVAYVESDIGPNGRKDDMNWITAAYGTDRGARDVRIERTRIHDIVMHKEGAHIDCLAADDVDGLVIRDSSFSNCEHFALLFGTDTATGRGARNVVVEGNELDCCRSGYYSIGLGQVDGPMVIRDNVANKNFGFLGGPVKGVEIHGNTLPGHQASTCDKAQWRDNRLTDPDSAICGPGEKHASG